MCCKILGKNCIADAEKLYYPTTPSTEVYIMRIGDLEPNSDSSDEEVEEGYINLDTSLATLISTIRSNQAKQSKVSKEELITQIL